MYYLSLNMTRRLMPVSNNKSVLLSFLESKLFEPDLIEQALTHRSLGSKNNEVLEFLGDSVLNLTITAELIKKFPESREGELSRLRAWYVRGSTLADIAEESELGEHLKLGEGELKSGGFRRRSIMADAVEALIGAVYQSAGFEVARDYVLTIYSSRLAAPPDPEALKDPKTRLQERLQSRGHPVPEYLVVKTSGKAHAQEFSVVCRIEALAIETSADGNSRRKAEQIAAEKALELVLNA